MKKKNRAVSILTEGGEVVFCSGFACAHFCNDKGCYGCDYVDWQDEKKRIAFCRNVKAYDDLIINSPVISDGGINFEFWD